MSYHVYTTEGLIIKKKSSGEQNVILYILTKDLGLVVVSARSTRSPKSKLRGLVEEYTQGYFSLVKGKNGWKLTNATDAHNLYFSCPDYSRKTLSQISSVLLKMIQGETPQKEVYKAVMSGLSFLLTAKKEDVYFCEILTVLRIMMILGYVESQETIQGYVQNDVFSNELLDDIKKNKIKIISIINKAIKESQL